MILRHKNTGENGLMVLSKGAKFNGNMHLGNVEELPKSPKVPKIAKIEPISRPMKQYLVFRI
jgi:hypothetical protein